MERKNISQQLPGCYQILTIPASFTLLIPGIRLTLLFLKGGMTTPIGEYSRLKIVLSDELNSIESNNYKEGVRRNNASVTLSAERKKGKRFGAVLLLRETLDDKSFLIPDYSAGFEFRVIRGEEHYLKLNLSRNSKIPSLNDLFLESGWQS